jgi:hypothetical protein
MNLMADTNPAQLQRRCEKRLGSIECCDDKKSVFLSINTDLLLKLGVAHILGRLLYCRWNRV